MILQKSHQNLSEKYLELNKEHAELKTKYDEERKIRSWQKNRKYKIVFNNIRNPEHNRLMKNHINRLVKK
ncbi:hypothetical protein [Chryseobacterium indoltheticum]|uniref:hypothetical protein n=1 Tax=Chryseobacterium indoltheticum TaxID=254 RepID=UPI003F4970A2